MASDSEEAKARCMKIRVSRWESVEGRRRGMGRSHTTEVEGTCKGGRNIQKWKEHAEVEGMHTGSLV